MSVAVAPGGSGRGAGAESGGSEKRTAEFTRAEEQQERAEPEED